MIYELNFEITDSDIQAPYNHVHHANSLNFLEKTRLSLIASKGFHENTFFEKNLFLVIASINVNYKREIKKGNIRVTCDQIIFDNKKIIIKQSIFNEQEKLAIEAEVVSMIMSGKTKRAVLPDQEFIDAMK
jgi:YbgC/YbaW family acyl-CoA thioester hydrolase